MTETDLSILTQVAYKELRHNFKSVSMTDEEVDILKQETLKLVKAIILVQREYAERMGL